MTELMIEQTCDICPEQYDVYHDDEQVGYIRIRHGAMTVKCPDVGGKVVLCEMTDGDGGLTFKERPERMFRALNAITRYVKEGAI